MIAIVARVISIIVRTLCASSSECASVKCTKKSRARTTIYTRMENEFGVKFKLTEVRSLKTIGDFVDLVKVKTK